MTNEQNFKDLIIRHLKELPPQQQLIAEYMLENPREIPFSSVPDLAQRIKVSEATVVRFAQRIGYDGFSSLKMDLLESMKNQVSDKETDLNTYFAAKRGSDTLSAAMRQEIQNIQATGQNISKEAFQKTAAALFKADHIYSFGLGVSSYLAEIFTYLLVQIGIRATAMTPKYSSPLEQLVPLRLTDLLVVFSFPPYSKPTIDVVSDAADRGITTLAICDRLSAPVAARANHVLTVRTDNMMFTNALAALTVVLNGLVTEIAVRHGDAAEAVNRINHILSADENLISQHE